MANKAGRVKVVQDELDPVPVELLATSIWDIAEAAKRMEASGLKRDGLVILLAESAGEKRTSVRAVLFALERLADDYLKPRAAKRVAAALLFVLALCVPVRAQQATPQPQETPAQLELQKEAALVQAQIKNDYLKLQGLTEFQDYMAKQQQLQQLQQRYVAAAVRPEMKPKTEPKPETPAAAAAKPANAAPETGQKPAASEGAGAIAGGRAVGQ
jgi:hypothetical protein